MKLFKALAVSFLIVAGCLNVQAQGRPMYEIHSMMVYNFMKYVNWPASAGSGDFVLGVIGEDDVYATLNKWYGSKTKGAQKIVIKQFSSPSDITDCHVLYVGKGKSSSFDEIKSKINGKTTLLITDKSGLGKKGSCINFKVVSGKLKFELNQDAVSNSQLKVSSQLTGMAILI